MPQPSTPFQPDVELRPERHGILHNPKTERFQSLIEALTAEFQHLQQAREDAARENSELQKQLHPMLPKETTFGSSEISHEGTDDTTNSRIKPNVSWDLGATDKSTAKVLVTPRQDHQMQPVEEEFHFSTPGKDQGKGNKGSPSSKKPQKLGPRSVAISSPLEPKEAPPLDDEANVLKDSDEAKRHNAASADQLVPVTKKTSKASSDGADRPTKNDSVNSLGVRSTMKEKEKTSTNWGTVLLDTVPAAVILANACTIGMSADIEPESDVWDVLEAVWIGFYFMEFCLKMLMFGPREYYFGRDKYWNWFDCTCLLVSIFDISMTYVLTFLPTTGGATGLMKMLRLARLLRIVRALHYSFFDELKQMLLGVVSGVRVLLWAIILLLVVVFFLGVALNSLYGEDQPELETVPRAMLTVFRCYTDGCSAEDGRPLQERLFEDYGAVFFFGYILSFMFVTVGIFNLIMAIFMDSVFSRSIKRKLHDLGQTAEAVEIRVKDTLAVLIYEYAGEHPNWDQTDLVESIQNRVSANSVTSQLLESDVSINRDVFKTWLGNKEFIDLLEDAGVEAATKAELFDVLDVDMGGELGLDELINGLMKLRGPITKSDIIAVRLKVRYITGMIEDIWRRLLPRDASKSDVEDEMKAVRRSTAFRQASEDKDLLDVRFSLLSSLEQLQTSHVKPPHPVSF